jgi:hypothetical protein
MCTPQLSIPRRVSGIYVNLSHRKRVFGHNIAIDVRQPSIFQDPMLKGRANVSSSAFMDGKNSHVLVGEHPNLPNAGDWYVPPVPVSWERRTD